MTAPAIVAAIAAIAPPNAGAASAPPLLTGFSDSVFTAAPAEREPWLQRAVDTGASIVRVDVGWPAPRTAGRPAGFAPRNPADPNYDFRAADSAVKAATAHGLRVLAFFTGAPAWAEGRGRPPSAPAGTWRPDPAALRDYGEALARRYSGTFPDPAQPDAVLPRVRDFQVWNEPNLAVYLTPQWARGRPFAPAHYRRMLNAFAAGAKAVHADNAIVTAGTAPFGDPQPGGRRIMPARFWRELLCLRGSRLRRGHCGAPARFDVLAHHPYSVGAPDRRALNADDVSIPDVGKLTRLLRRAVAVRAVSPATPKRVWVTEVSYDSSPPDPNGVPAARHARWLETALHLLWKQGVSAVLWFQIRDQAPVPSYAATNQSGVFLRDGTAKLAATAFGFPFVTERVRGGLVRVWAVAPTLGTLSVENAAGRVVATRPVPANRVVSFVVRGTGRGAVRGRVGARASLFSRPS